MTANIEKLKERLEKARRELNEANRKADTRKKVILGSCILLAVEKGFLNEDWTKKLLEKFVTRKSDREFMGLAALPMKTENNTNNISYQQGE